ncbi:MAG: hypothetical protein EP297_13585 [Gammaproteobacteria bacterium]|nr:MAG: hypothetical protein EP297_13585 [Gammaproteobacteria bacterium]
MKDCPIFPLHTVLFPGGILPLQIFEARYLDMVAKCMRKNTGFVIALIKEGQETGQPASHHTIGTYCNIIDFDQQDNGLLSITVKGEYRVKIENTHIGNEGLIIGNAKQLSSITLDTIHEADEQLVSVINQVKSKLGKPFSELSVPANDTIWLFSRLVEWSAIELDKKYELLCQHDGQEMLKKALELLQSQG